MQQNYPQGVPQARQNWIGAGGGSAKSRDLVIPNPKLKLMDQVREVLRVKHYALRTEQAYCEWIRRYVKFHRMRSREELFPRNGQGGTVPERSGRERPRGGFHAEPGIQRPAVPLRPGAAPRRQRDEKPAGLSLRTYGKEGLANCREVWAGEDARPARNEFG